MASFEVKEKWYVTLEVYLGWCLIILGVAGILVGSQPFFNPRVGSTSIILGALALYRVKKYRAKRSVSDIRTGVQPPYSPSLGKNQKRLYVLLVVAAWTSLVVLVGLAEPFNPGCCVGDWSTDLQYKLNALGGMFMFALALPVIFFGAILFWWYGKTSSQKTP